MSESQNTAIRKWLEEGNTLTPLEALDRFGCLRLSGRAYDLKKEGLDVRTRMIETHNGKRVAEYYIPREGKLF